MGKKLAVDGWTINDLLEYCVNNDLFVDQKYQRKLVWSLKDKQLFIDSLFNRFPIPNIMMVEYSDNNNISYGIIDGLQRINAIISFMLNEFPISIDGKLGYFDITAAPDTFDMNQNGLLNQKTPVLDKRVCTEFRSYKLPIISTSHDTSTIDEIFKRLNSTGTKLSRQDLRQAGATNAFSRIVREISSTIRGGKTASDIVNLNLMPEISLSNEGLSYGININSVFWRKHGILTEDFLRKSKDEEIIATLIGAFLLDRPTMVITSGILDDLYSDDTEDSRIANDKLANCYENLKTLIIHIFNEMDMVYDTTGHTISELLFIGEKRKADIFAVFFMTMLQLFFEDKAIGDYYDFADTIKNIKEQLLLKLEQKTSADYITEKNTIKFLRDVMDSHLVSTESNSPLINDIISRLNLSAAETRFTEYKIGFTFFNCPYQHKHNEGKLNYKNVSKIAKVAAAMANLERKENFPCMIIVGIADNEFDYRAWSSFFKTNAYKYNTHRVVGIDEEAKKYYKNIDNLMKAFIMKLDEEPISDELKTNLKNFDIITIQKRSLVVFTITAETGQLYNGKKYIREGSSLKAI